MRHLVSLCRRVRAPALATACALAAAHALAAPDAAGRWEGVADVPGNPLRLVVDIDRDTGGQWAGSVILPERGVKGAPLDELAVSGSGCDVRFALAAAFAGGSATPPRMALACRADGTLAGTFELGGRSTGVTLHRAGPAQVDRPPANGVVDAALAGLWTGRYELGGFAREVTLTLANHAETGGGGKLVIVGKRTTTLDIDQIVRGREFVTLRASAANYCIEGRLTADGAIEGSVIQGPFEAAIVLRRADAAGEKAS